MNNMYQIGMQGFSKFRKHYEDIYMLYKKNGISILEQMLDESEKEIKEIFLEVDNENNTIYNALQYVFNKKRKIKIQNGSDIKEVSELVGIGKKIYMDTNDINKNYLIYITEEFFKRLFSYIKGEYVYLMNENKIYQIYLDFENFSYIKIINIIPIEKILKD